MHTKTRGEKRSDKRDRFRGKSLLCISLPCFTFESILKCLLMRHNLKLKDGIQERVTYLERRLAEEKDWRKRLEVDLTVAQSSLKKEKQVGCSLILLLLSF